MAAKVKQTRRIRQIIRQIPNLKSDYYVEINRLLDDIEAHIKELEDQIDPDMQAVYRVIERRKKLNVESEGG